MRVELRPIYHASGRMSSYCMATPTAIAILCTGKGRARAKARGDRQTRRGRDDHRDRAFLQRRVLDDLPITNGPRLMAKSNSFRFAISDASVRSECWTVFTNKDDVYLTGSAYRKALKVSLHGSGVCQIALLEQFVAKHVEGRDERPEDRTILRWKRLTTPEGRGQVAATILFASYEFWPEQEEMPRSKPYTKLRPPPDMHARMIDVVYSRDDPKRIAELGEWTDELLYSFQLPSGEFVALVQRVEPLPEGFFDFAPMPGRYGLSLGIGESEMDDARGISTFDCAQLYEGHACIRSLHNMRFVTVPGTELPDCV